jgi:Asp/Glu/hydantoin racemase
MGGHTTYGQDIGILMLDTVFPRLVGDIGNARTFSVPVKYRVVPGVDVATLTERNAETGLVEPFLRAAQALEAEGCRAITTSCSFPAGFQRRLADAVHIPVFASTLLLAPMLHTMLNRDRTIGILSDCPDLMTDAYFREAGWTGEQIPVCVSGPVPDSEFSRLILGDYPEGSLAELERCIREMAERHIRQYPHTGAILLECSNFAPFSHLIQRVTGVPVFGLNQLVEYMDACLNPPRYRND